MAAMPPPTTAPARAGADDAPEYTAILRPEPVMSAAAASERTVKLRLYAIGMPGSYASIATKWVAQMPKPVAMAAAMIQRARALPAVARARLNKLTAVRLANRHSTAATPTRLQSCSTVRQVKTRNIFHRSRNLVR